MSFVQSSFRFSVNHAYVFLALWAGAPSCWNTLSVFFDALHPWLDNRVHHMYFCIGSHPQALFKEELGPSLKMTPITITVLAFCGPFCPQKQLQGPRQQLLC